MISNEDIVIYNKVVEDRETRYIPHVLSSVYWEGDKRSNIVTSGMDSADSIRIIISRRVLDNQGKQYIGQLEYRQLDKEERDKYFTIGTGDRVIRGNKIYDIGEVDKRVEGYTVTRVDEKFIGSYRMHHLDIGVE